MSAQINNGQGLNFQSLALGTSLYNHPHYIVPRTAAQLTGIMVEKQLLGLLLLPIFWENGQIFAEHLLPRQNCIATATADTLEGTIIKYKNRKNQICYGRIIEPHAWIKQKGIYLKPISQKEALYLQKNQTVEEILELTEQDVKPLSEALLEQDKTKIEEHDTSLVKHLGNYYKQERVFAVNAMLWIYSISLLLILATIIIVLLQ